MIEEHFKNTMAWRLVEGLDVADISYDTMADIQARAPASHEAVRHGWAPPFNGDDFLLDLSGDGSAGHLICMVTSARKLSGKVVTQEVARRAGKLSRDEGGRRIAAREKQRTKEQVLDEFLPKAFVEHSSTYALIKPPYIFVATGSAKVAETLLDLLRTTLGSLKVIPVSSMDRPLQSYTDWFTSGEVTSTDDFKLGNKFTVHDENTKRKVAGNWEAGDTELADQLIRGGAKATVLELAWTARRDDYDATIAFTTNEMLGLKAIQWPSAIATVAQDQIGETDDEDHAVLFEQALTLILSDEISRLWGDLLRALGGERLPENRESDESLI